MLPQVRVPREQSLVCRILIKEFLRDQHLNGREERSSGQREKVELTADPMIASANPTESSGANTALQNCPPLVLDGLYIPTWISHWMRITLPDAFVRL